MVFGGWYMDYINCLDCYPLGHRPFAHCRDKTNPMQRPLSCSGMALLQVREPRPDIVQSTTTVVLHREAHVFSSYHIHQNSNPNDSAR